MRPIADNLEALLALDRKKNERCGEEKLCGNIIYLFDTSTITVETMNFI